MNAFTNRYGAWAIVAGASEGLGAAFAEAIAKAGVHVVLVARRQAALEELAKGIEARHHVKTLVIVADLGDANFIDKIAAATEGLDVGLAVYNAAHSTIGAYLDQPLSAALRTLEVNCVGPLRFVHALAPAMVTRGRGGVVLMSSLAGFQGGPRLASYAASKAFNLILGESLWAELRPRGVDVIVSCPGAVRTPNYQKTAKGDAPGTLDPAVVVDKTLAALGRGPVVVPGGVNKLARFVLGRVLSRRAAVGVMDRSTRTLE